MPLRPPLHIPEDIREFSRWCKKQTIPDITDIGALSNATSLSGGREGNNLSGSATLIDGFALIAFGTAEPDKDYCIHLTGDANETFYWSQKKTTGFRINSSNASSTATVDWLIVGY